MEDFYDLLEVTDDACEAEIRLAYRKKALQYHPDTTELDKEFANDKMVLINLAWETLRDANLRAEYNRTRPRSKSTVWPEPDHVWTQKPGAEGVRMVPVVSKMISEIGHDGTDRLYVQFVKGGFYVYSGVPYLIYDEVVRAESKGRALIRLVINGSFAYQRLRN